MSRQEKNMAAKNIMMSFQLYEGNRTDDSVLEAVRAIPSLCMDGELNCMENSSSSLGGYVLLSTNQEGSHVVVHCYANGLITVDVQHLMSEKSSDTLQDEIKVR
ncbi:uncharacterized protein LOC134273816 [Saccostrea cucullata]|uniref:uncharacterized protein LOC134273816 n=1 Tax=Saccostrea cuccullata TaxID=36930 RepID=UPI002ED5388E